jgi:hypothetical protein
MSIDQYMNRIKPVRVNVLDKDALLKEVSTFTQENVMMTTSLKKLEDKPLTYDFVKKCLRENGQNTTDNILVKVHRCSGRVTTEVPRGNESLAMSLFIHVGEEDRFYYQYSKKTVPLDIHCGDTITIPTLLSGFVDGDDYVIKRNGYRDKHIYKTWTETRREVVVDPNTGAEKKVVRRVQVGRPRLAIIVVIPQSALMENVSEAVQKEMAGAEEKKE